MTDILNIPGLALATFILGISPGPAVFATLSVALSHSRQSIVLFITGILMGDILFASLAMMGLGAIANEIPAVLLAIRILGGFYLIYLGIRAWPKKEGLETVNDNIPIQTIPLASRYMFLAGFILTAGNPKDLLFFVTFLPAFIDLQHAEPAHIIMATLTIAGAFLVTLSLYAGAAQIARRYLLRPRVRYGFDILSSTILMGIGVYLLTPT